MQDQVQPGVPLGDIPDDSGYAHRVPRNRAVPLRAAGARLIQDLRPDDRGPRGTYAGAVIPNGNLYCPATPRPLLDLGPSPATPPPGKPPPTTTRPPRQPAASSARSPPTTPAATTASCAPPPWENSAARYDPSP
ncbi:MAG TPA: hypothetical protein VMV92_36660 [Streptosporangiaceae bacterium]|nr:hypothetical protein [Streptosporangiaceae bacterium]HVB45062.1 hypothetical protein [Streptosporangiaceae bacterium]